MIFLNTDNVVRDITVESCSVGNHQLVGLSFSKLKKVMKKRRFLLVFALMTTLFANAQWRVGVTAGADYNVFSIDKQYMTDVLFDGRWGVTCGVTGQYNFTD